MCETPLVMRVARPMARGRQRRLNLFGALSTVALLTKSASTSAPSCCAFATALSMIFWTTGRPALLRELEQLDGLGRVAAAHEIGDHPRLARGDPREPRTGFASHLETPLGRDDRARASGRIGSRGVRQPCRKTVVRSGIRPTPKRPRRGAPPASPGGVPRRPRGERSSSRRYGARAANGWGRRTTWRAPGRNGARCLASAFPRSSQAESRQPICVGGRIARRSRARRWRADERAREVQPSSLFRVAFVGSPGDPLPDAETGDPRPLPGRALLLGGAGGSWELRGAAAVGLRPGPR